MEKTYEELHEEDLAVEHADRLKILLLLGMLRPGMSGLEIILQHSKVCDDPEVRKRTGPYNPMEYSDTLEIIEAMSAKERAALRARILR